MATTATSATSTTSPANSIEAEKTLPWIQIVKESMDQMHITWLALEDTVLQIRRKIRRTYLDAREWIMDDKNQKMIVSALTDKSPVSLTSIDDRVELQEFYFGISLLMMALSVGGIIGNLWAELDWPPQMGVFCALTTIVMLLCKLWTMLVTQENPVDLKISMHRSFFVCVLFGIGFSLGQFCSYSLPMTLPRLLCPLALAYLLDHKAYYLFPCCFKGIRIKFFAYLASLVYGCSVVLLFLLWQFSSTALSFMLVMCTIKLAFIIAHFQMLYYIYCTLAERNREIQQQEDDEKKKAPRPVVTEHGHGGGSQQPEKTDINLWNDFAHFFYVLAAILLDLLIGACLTCIF